ncbi:MAG: adenylate/guanylate cyclase domain-containing protein [Planctomycetota bacterium]
MGHAFDKWELAVYDAFCIRNIEKTEKSNQVALILIDTKSLEWGVEYYDRHEKIAGVDESKSSEFSLDAMYLWPWKRMVYESIINFLAQGGARVIAFDMVFDSAHNSGDINSDLSLAYSTLMQNEEGATYVIHTINFRASKNPPENTSLTEFQKRSLEAASLKVEGIDSVSFPFDRSDEGIYYGPIIPYKGILQEIVDASTGSDGLLRLGAVCAQIDIDSVIRRARVLTQFQNWVFPSLGLAAAMAYLESVDGKGSVTLRVDDEGLILNSKSRNFSTHIPLTPSGDILVNWKDTGEEGYGGEGRFKTYPAYRILLSAMDDERFLQEMAEDPDSFRVDPAEFKDKIVFIGANALGLYDLKATPISENYPGVKVHAAVVENVLNHDPIFRLPLFARAIIVLLLTLITFLLTMILKRAAWKFIFVAAVMVLFSITAKSLFSNARVWIDTVAPLSGVLIAYMSGITYNFFTEGRHKREITRMFQHYVPPDIVASLVKRPDALNTRGERKEITVFFSDIKGFTSLSNTPKMRQNPDLLTNHLNEYLSEMTSAIHECGGTLDKYIGDAVVAFFGAPLPMENHAREACRAALACQERLVHFNTRAKERDLPELLTRIGLFTGEAMVGNVGSKVRLSYTAIGSTVNFGARLEGVNKVYGTWILAGEQTVLEAGTAVNTRYIDKIRVPGVIEEAPPLKVFQVLSMAGVQTAETGCVSLFQKAMELYQDGAFEMALPFFEQAEREFGDAPSVVFADRCRILMKNPPETWNGVWRITSK